MARSERVRESTDFLRSLPFRPDITLKKRVQNDTACLLPGGLQNWSRAIVNTELTQCPSDPHDWSSVQQAGGQAGRIGALRGRLNRFIFTHCERSDGSSVLASELTHQAVPPEHEVTTQCPLQHLPVQLGTVPPGPAQQPCAAHFSALCWHFARKGSLGTDCKIILTLLLTIQLAYE